jgi:hypothetical protein
MDGLRMIRGTVLCALLGFRVAACGEAERATPSPADTVLTPGGATSVPPAEARHFDAATLGVDDSFLGLRVIDADVRRVFDDSV